MKEKKTLWQAIKYLLFSISAGLIQEGSFALLFNVAFQGAQKWYWLCYMIGLVLSILWNFTLNRKYTFQSANNVPIAMLKVLGFYLVFTPVTMWLGQLVVEAGINGNFVNPGTMVLNFVLEFLYYKFVVFREEKK